jgi:hypothetical protein
VGKARQLRVKEALMKRQIIVSLVLLAILVAGVSGNSCAKKATEPPPPEQPVTPPSIPEEGVYLNPPLIEAEPGQELSIKIEVKPSGWGVSGGEINLAFNSGVLKVVNIEPGNFLGSNPIVGSRQVDNQAGVIRLALARVGKTPVPSPSGVLATVDFKISDLATSGTYELKLTKVGLANENFQDITGFTIQGTIIKISSS